MICVSTSTGSRGIDVKSLALAAAIFLSGCASSLLNPLPDDVPEGAEVIRCTKYEGIIAGYFTGSSARFTGCQCVRMGKQDSQLSIKMSDCSADLSDKNG